MAAELIINVTFNETRIAFLENGSWSSFSSRERTTRDRGEHLQGKVARVVPGMDAAFVDVGLRSRLPVCGRRHYGHHDV